jgi:uncharacterized linocin/CFP29 family protein
LAPLTGEAWEEVDSAAAEMLKAQLSARKLVDFEGPHGPHFSAVNLGQLDLAESDAPGGVPWGLRCVQPLVEVRIPFMVNQMELDNISRGCKDADLGAVEEAAQKLVQFEETAIYRGFEEGGIEGIIPASPHDVLPMPSKVEDLAKTTANGVRELRQTGIEGPYTLVLGSDHYYPLMQAGSGGYPPKRIIRDTLGGEILWSPAVEGGLLLSTRGGDFELVVGEDISIGYAAHDREEVELYLMESFTFRVLEPAAAIALEG